jgi:hypothetical protein
VIRSASMPRAGSYSVIRSFLNVPNPVFHAATMKQFVRGLRVGIRSESTYFELRGTGLRGIPFSRNLNLLMSNPYGRPYILIFDLDRLSKRYAIEETAAPDDVGGYIHVLREGIIPSAYIRGLIVGNRMYDMRSQPITKPGGGPGPLPSRIAPPTVMP